VPAWTYKAGIPLGNMVCGLAMLVVFTLPTPAAPIIATAAAEQQNQDNDQNN
jgi:hypothetical protein